MGRRGTCTDMANGRDSLVGNDQPLMVVGRYAIYDEIAAGGMATVHLGRLLGPVGFSRTVAIKRLHAHLSKDPEFTSMFLDEARLAARIRHPNVVSTLDVVARDGELFLVMDYVHGASLTQLLVLMYKRQERLPLGIAGNLISSLLQGLHAAHEARSDRGEPLGIVHRDVSPQNLLVGMDGVARLVDFGVAKAMGRVSTTAGGQIKGKVAYMAPEQIMLGQVTRAADIWGAGVVLYQMLTGSRLFVQNTEGETLYKIIAAEVPPPSTKADGISPELDAVVLKALSKEPKDRFQTAREMAAACEKALPVVTQREVAEWMDGIAAAGLERLASRVAEIESLSLSVDHKPSSPPPRNEPPSLPERSVQPVTASSPPGPEVKRWLARWSWLIAAGLAVGVIAGIAAAGLLRSKTAGAVAAPSASAVVSPSTAALVSAVPSQQSPAAASAGPSIADPASSPVATATAAAVPKRSPGGTAGAPPVAQKKPPKPGSDSLYVRE